MTAPLIAPVYKPMPGRCGAASTDGGPSCGRSPARLFPGGWRCAQCSPVNRKTGKPVPFLHVVKESPA